MNRRHFFRLGAALAAGFALPPIVARRSVLAAVRPLAPQNFGIEKIERTAVKVPYRPVPERAMDRELPHWRYFEICEVQLACGAVGFGESMLYYTWGATGDAEVERARGRNAVELLWDDSLGSGLQTALFDAVGKAASVPAHRLLGRKVNERTPLSWWNIDMPPEDMAAECLEARRQGYLSYKTKGRPWFDLWKQVEASAAAVPPEFKIDMDFNDTLRDAARALPILKDLERFPQVDIYETPIPQSDVEGNKAICDATRVKIAMHYGNPPPRVVAQSGCCDGFVVGGGAGAVLRAGAFASAADMPFWLQLVGTGITAAFSLHLGAVLSHARWPAVNCHQLYTHTLLKEAIEVKDGYAAVPDRPGLGFELDREAMQRFRIERPKERPDPPRLVEVSWPDGRRLYIASNNEVNFVLTQGNKGTIPFYERGASARLFADDGTPRWKQLYEGACKAPVLERQ